MDEPLDVIIVGAGLSGIGMAAHLTRRCPAKRFVVIERRAALGGTWDLFRYPGVRSDSDMYSLGYAFEPWTGDRAIAEGQAVRGYLADVADKYDVTPHIRFNHMALTADWNSETGLWTIITEDGHGTRETTAGRFLFFGAGYYDYDTPHDAAIPGLDGFTGTVIHPQFWPPGFDLAGKHVVVIGSGATAATLVPALANDAAHVTMLQRTPSWYIARPSRDRLAGLIQRLLPRRAAYGLIRRLNVALHQMFVHRSRTQPGKVGQWLHAQIEAALGPAFDKAAFTPPYGPWEQRLCLVPDGDLFDALRSGNADIVTGTIAAVDANGVVLDDGRKLDADVIVTATGLRLATLGKVAVTLDGAPVDFTQTFYYRNCMFSGVPNMAALFGYLGAAWTLRVDIVADWLCRLFDQMDAWQVDVATPTLPTDQELEDGDLLAGFSSGYLRRARDIMPRTATAAPWRLSMDYFADRKEMRDAPIDDGMLRFERLPIVAPAALP